MVYATRCGHPLCYAELQCCLLRHDFDHGPMTGSSTETEKYSAIRLATPPDIDSIRRSESCQLCSLDTTPADGPPND